MVDLGYVPAPDEPALNDDMQEALAVWRMLGERLDWQGLPLVCGAYQIELTDALVQRLLLLRAELPGRHSV